MIKKFSDEIPCIPANQKVMFKEVFEAEKGTHFIAV
jgi:hypothetical protein